MTIPAHTETMSDNRKIQILRDYPRVKRIWDRDLSRDEKRFVLAAMEIGLTDCKWLTQVIADAKAMREGKQ